MTAGGGASVQVKVTIKGFSHIADIAVSPALSQAFVAMWFSDEMKEPYEKGIRPAIERLAEYLKEGRTGKNILHKLISLLRQSIYSRLAGYDDTNDADRLSQDPAMRVVVGWKGPDRKAASTSEMSRFETELLTQKDNRKGLEQLNVEWVKRGVAKTVHRLRSHED